MVGYINTHFADYVTCCIHHNSHQTTVKNFVCYLNHLATSSFCHLDVFKRVEKKRWLIGLNHMRHWSLTNHMRHSSTRVVFLCT